MSIPFDNTPVHSLSLNLLDHLFSFVPLNSDTPAVSHFRTRLWGAGLKGRSVRFLKTMVNKNLVKTNTVKTEYRQFTRYANRAAICFNAGHCRWFPFQAEAG